MQLCTRALRYMPERWGQGWMGSRARKSMRYRIDLRARWMTERSEAPCVWRKVKEQVREGVCACV
ncbi:hypothetical protein KSC_106320 [Ktedonobacter sp. SOSP1-52]|nr:hypothetical protein KSC_106320 [Ktedonobacter sp. SOSP1-52]